MAKNQNDFYGVDLSQPIEHYGVKGMKWYQNIFGDDEELLKAKKTQSHTNQAFNSVGNVEQAIQSDATWVAADNEQRQIRIAREQARTKVERAQKEYDRARDDWDKIKSQWPDGDEDTSYYEYDLYLKARDKLFEAEDAMSLLDSRYSQAEMKKTEVREKYEAEAAELRKERQAELEANLAAQEAAQKQARIDQMKEAKTKGGTLKADEADAKVSKRLDKEASEKEALSKAESHTGDTSKSKADKQDEKYNQTEATQRDELKKAESHTGNTSKNKADREDAKYDKSKADKAARDAYTESRTTKQGKIASSKADRYESRNDDSKVRWEQRRAAETLARSLKVAKTATSKADRQDEKTSKGADKARIMQAKIDAVGLKGLKRTASTANEPAVKKMQAFNDRLKTFMEDNAKRLEELEKKRQKKLAHSDEIQNGFVTGSAEADEFIAHWGLLGMRWGRRRFRNYDNSLTPEGKARYYKRYGKSISKYTNEELREAIERVKLERAYIQLFNEQVHDEEYANMAYREAKRQELNSKINTVGNLSVKVIKPAADVVNTVAAIASGGKIKTNNEQQQDKKKKGGKS